MTKIFWNKQKQHILTKKTVNIYVVYDISLWSCKYSDNLAWGSSLFVVKLSYQKMLI